MRIGLQVNKCLSMLKMVNAKTQSAMGMAYNVRIIVDNWFIRTNVLVIHLKDFDLTLGIDYCWKAKLAPMPHLDGVMIM